MRKKIRPWRSDWDAESATFDEARALRRRLVKRLRRGDGRQRALAGIIGRCHKGTRCGSAYCPVCERRRGRHATRDARPRPTVVIVRASEIKPARIDWVWPGIIASGRVTGLVGHPGLGKSQVAMDIAATVSTGRDWPGGATNGKAAHVIVLSAEDDAADTIVPRLIAARADRTRIHVVKAVKEEHGEERPFNLGLDLDRLESENDLEQVSLLIIDPVSAYLTRAKGRQVNRNNAGDVRTIQARLAKFAEDHDLGVLAISHLNKTGGARAITRIMGSLEWAAAPRAVFLVTEEPGTARRLFLPLKNNLAPDRT